MVMTAINSQSTPLFEARDIRKYFEIQPKLAERVLARAHRQVIRAVDGVSLKIWPGETIGLVGESGCGKTTLGHVLIQLYEPTEGQILYRGEPVKNGKVAVPADGSSKPQQVPFYHLAQIIFQNPYSSLNPRKTVREILQTTLRHRGLTDPSRQDKDAAELLHRVGLNVRHLNAYPHQFSGGQRQRIGIARALAMRPQFIVADEPVSSLDVSIQAQVINLLEELQEEYKLTYLFIAHDLSVIKYISRRVAIMYLGRVVEEGPKGPVFETPLHPYTQALMAAIPRIRKDARRQRILLQGNVPSPIDPPKGCPFHTRCFAKVGKICEEKFPEYYQVGEQRVACWIYEQSGQT